MPLVKAVSIHTSKQQTTSAEIDTDSDYSDLDIPELEEVIDVLRVDVKEARNKIDTYHSRAAEIELILRQEYPELIAQLHDKYNNSNAVDDEDEWQDYDDSDDDDSDDSDDSDDTVEPEPEPAASHEQKKRRKSLVKALFRAISQLTHPDKHRYVGVKTEEEKEWRLDIYRRALKCRSENDLDGLRALLLELDASVPVHGKKALIEEADSLRAELHRLRDYYANLSDLVMFQVVRLYDSGQERKASEMFKQILIHSI